jgi:hypothetical protein
MADIRLRKTILVVEDTKASNGIPVEPQLRTAAAAAVIANPYAGRYVEDLEPLVQEFCEPLGELLAGMAHAALGAPAEAYGKGALVGMTGEVEHGSAVIHNLLFGNFVRDAAQGTALLPSAEKRGVAGTPLDVPLKHKDDPALRSHHQTFEVRVADAPAADEIVIWVALATGGRPLARLRAFGSELAETPPASTPAR